MSELPESKCDGLHCPKKENCNRYKSITNPRMQIYYVYPPGSFDVNTKEFICEMFTPLKEENNAKG